MTLASVRGGSQEGKQLEEDVMCVWDGTYTAQEAEREAMDQVPGWNDEAASIPERRRAQAEESLRDRCCARTSSSYLKAA